jgi:hypothetical protein
MRSTLLAAFAAGASFCALSASADAMPAAGIGQGAGVAAPSAVEKVEFRRRPDGSIYYVRPDFSGERTHYFAYRGYAYPYNPGYTYRLSRGELRPDDKLRRYRITQ